MPGPRILTFNFHEPYICLMAKTGLNLEVGLYEEGPLARPWHAFFRKPPENIRLVPEQEWRAELAAGRYAAAIAQNESNALDIAGAPCRKLLLCHNRRTFLTTTVSAEQAHPEHAYEQLVLRLREDFRFVYISESKRDDYGHQGPVIRPGIDVEEWGGYEGGTARVLRVGNTMRERNLMFDVDLQEEACHGLPSIVVGTNPAMADSAPAETFEALRDHYRNNRALLHVSRKEYEDGYNLSTLEAMASGMPVVSLSNPTSPITDGIDGYTSYEAPVLRGRLAALLEDIDLAREIGAKGRETVAREFPIEAFAENWRRVVEETLDGGTVRGETTVPPAPPRPRLLVHFITSPLTTGRYFEPALQEAHDVLTTGDRVPEQVLRNWGFEEPIPPYRPQQIPIRFDTPYTELLASLPRGYRDSTYFYVDCGLHELPADLGALPFRKAAYLIDTHVSPEFRLAIARGFDCVFLAQKGQVDLFRNAGIEHVSWVPLGCSPTLHGLPPMDRRYDVSYVGSFSAEEVSRRDGLLREVRARFPNSYIGRAWPEDMARIYAQSKIVVNACYNVDVNMRVFEAMASGALLITDEAVGLEDLFEDGKHLVVYRNDADLPGLIERYLADDKARERIARAGQELVLREHTYQHRADAIMAECARVFAEMDASPAPKDQDYYEHERRELIPHVPHATRRLLDIGCGAGTLGALLKQERGLEFVAGVEYVESAYRRAKTRLDQALHGDIEALELPFEDGYFDCIIFADILEHLKDPAAVLRKLSRVLAPGGVILISIPNIQYHEVPAMLASGGWTYMDQGIMDSTHLRFFTRETLRNMIEDAGLEAAAIAPLSMRPPEHCPLDEDGALRMGKVTVRDLTEREYENFLVYQYIAQACKPGVDRLAKAREALEQGQNDLAYAFAVDAVGVDEREQRHVMAKALVRVGRLDDAQAHYKQLVDTGDEPLYAAEYGILLVGMNRPNDARPLLESSLAADPGNHRARGALGLVHYLAGEWDEAHKLLRESLAAGFDNLPLLPQYLDTARRTANLEGAADLLTSFAEFYPGNFGIACDLARTLHELGRGGEAREKLDLVLMLDPENAAARALLAELDKG